jgi:hypothetical protein
MWKAEGYKLLEITDIDNTVSAIREKPRKCRYFPMWEEALKICRKKEVFSYILMTYPWLIYGF